MNRSDYPDETYCKPSWVDPDRSLTSMEKFSNLNAHVRLGAKNIKVTEYVWFEKKNHPFLFPLLFLQPKTKSLTRSMLCQISPEIDNTLTHSYTRPNKAETKQTNKERHKDLRGSAGAYVHGEERNNFTITNRNTTSGETLKTHHKYLSLTQMTHTSEEDVDPHKCS